MPKYLIQASYSLEGAAGLLKDGGASSSRRGGPVHSSLAFRYIFVSVRCSVDFTLVDTDG